MPWLIWHVIDIGLATVVPIVIFFNISDSTAGFLVLVVGTLGLGKLQTEFSQK